MFLTIRDQEILEDIRSYGILTTRMIAARHFPGVAMTTVLRRLRMIEATGYVCRITGLEGAQTGWVLTKTSAQKMHPTPSKIHFPRFILDHDLKLTHLRLALEAAGVARSWKPEHEIRAKVAARHGLRKISERVIPDGLIGVEVKGAKESIALELELSCKNQKRYRSIFREYRYKENLWAIWYVVSKATIGRQLAGAAKEARCDTYGPYFLWSVLADVMANPANARVNGFSKPYRVKDIWKPSPAHTPAQGVSGQMQNSKTKENELSASIETKTPAPHAI